jgi:hypothetical protein
MHLTPLRGSRSEAFYDVASCRESFQSIDAAQVMPKALGRFGLDPTALCEMKHSLMLRSEQKR